MTAMSTQSSKKAKVTALPVIQSNDPVGRLKAIGNKKENPADSPTRPTLHPCQGQITTFIDILGTRLDGCEEMKASRNGGAPFLGIPKAYYQKEIRAHLGSHFVRFPWGQFHHARTSAQ